jgi:flagellar basal-body rod modification protein FlgD
VENDAREGSGVMPEIGRPQNPQAQQYSQVTMEPRSSSNRKSAEESEREKLINQATGRKPESIHKDGAHNQMGKDEFLKLLTFQLQHQDPMNPVDQSKMTGELAQFSQLEQLSNLNSKFDQNNKNQMIKDKFYAASFVGKRVVTSGTSLKLTEPGQSSDVLFKIEAPAKQVVIRILDEKNQTVGEIWKENMAPGPQQITWDGVSLDGQLAAKGNYQVMVKAWDQTGKPVGAQTQATGMVSSVNFEEGEPVLTVEGQKVYLRDVSSFHQADQMDNAAGQKTPSSMSGINPLPLSHKPMMPAAQAQAVKSYQNSNEGIYD